METKSYIIKELKILSPFFEDPEKGFQIREVSRITKINHTTVRNYLNKFVKEDLLEVNKSTLYPTYRSRISKKYLNLKIYYNLEKLRSSELIEEIEKVFDYPKIVLFGSYAKARDTISSDIDFCIISEVNKEISLEKYEKQLKRKIQIHLLNKKTISLMKTKNPNMLNNITNGIVISGELELI